MDKITIGINQRIPIHILELALCAALQDDASPEYFSELAATEYNGENRIKKAVSVINKLTIRNPLFGYLHEHADVVMAAMKNKLDRPLLFGAVICAAYPFGFDTLSIMGKYFHVQQQVNSALITQRMASKYGSNRSLPNALYCVLPMFIWHYFVWRELRLSLTAALLDVTPFCLVAILVMVATYFATAAISNLYLLLITRILLAAVIYVGVLWLLKAEILRECIGYIKKRS